jgi:hypothetical protein
MSLIKANAVQVGQSPTATQNFTLAVPSSPDGTIKLARGNAGATTQDVISVDASGNVNGIVKSTNSTTSRSLANRFADVVNVKDFGAVGDGVTDDTAAIQATITYASNNKAVYFPTGIYKISLPININTEFNIFGDGETSIVKQSDFTKSAFSITPSTTLYNCSISNIKFYSDSRTTDVNHCAILFTSLVNTHTIEHSIFSNIFCENYNTFVKDTIPPRTTGFGLEANINWTIWNNIQIVSVQKFGFNLQNGSGTGNTWDNIRCRTNGASSAVWNFAGNNCVVGDVIITNAHLNCNTPSGSVGIRIEDNTVYRAQWTIANCQFDAECDVPISMSNLGSRYVNWNFANNNLGGNTDFGDWVEPMSGSVIFDRDASCWKSGNVKNIAISGFNSVDCFEVKVLPNASCTFEVNVAGLIGGLQSSVSNYKFSIRSDGTNPVIIDLIEYDLNANPLANNYFVICTPISTTTAKITIEFTSTNAGNEFYTTLTATGYYFKVKRI